MAFTTPIKLSKAPTCSPPIESHALQEHSRNIRDKCVLSGNSIAFRPKDFSNNLQNESVKSTGVLIYEINLYCSISAGSRSRNTKRHRSKINRTKDNKQKMILKRHSFVKSAYAMVGFSNPCFSTLIKEVCDAKVGKDECFFYGGFDFWRSNDLPDFRCGR